MKVSLRHALLLSLPLGLVACIGSGTRETEAPEVQATEDGQEPIEVRLARMGLEKARHEADKEVADARRSLEADRRDEAVAASALAAFVEASPVRLEKARLDLERAVGRARDAELELAELEAMYAEEEFAAKTKELVLTRGRRNLDHARRALDLERLELQQLETIELVNQEAKLQSALASAQGDVASAEEGLKIAELGRELAIAEAEEELRSAEEEAGEDG
jgi:hypothetical protein